MTSLNAQLIQGPIYLTNKHLHALWISKLSNISIDPCKDLPEHTISPFWQDRKLGGSISAAQVDAPATFLDPQKKLQSQVSLEVYLLLPRNDTIIPNTFCSYSWI